MNLALDNLISKGVTISEDEVEGALIAILLHDLGHGPFSHVLENMIMPGIPHEHVTELIMEKLNSEFNGKLDIALRIFRGKYRKKFLNQLVSGQLDVDRLDYLARDSFYTGVDEGKIGADRIIKMLAVKNGELVVEEKALYSLENFLNARRLMYWQVYLHKTTLSVEKMLDSIWTRARNNYKRSELSCQNQSVEYFLHRPKSKKRVEAEELEAFLELDDHDVWAEIKSWSRTNDQILSELCKGIINRDLFKVEFLEKPVSAKKLAEKRDLLKKKKNFKKGEEKFFFKSGSISNAAYIRFKDHIMVLKRDGKTIDIAEAADLPNIKAISKKVKKYYLCYQSI